MAGYSSRSLAEKLGADRAAAVLPMGAPDDYAALLDTPIPLIDAAPTGGAALVHLFVLTCAELERDLPAARAAMASDGALWVSWYKKAAKIPTDVTEDVIRDLALRGDLVDVKVCAVSDIWSGLKLVVRKGLRPKA